MSGAGRAAIALVSLAILDVLARPLVPVPRKSTLFVRDAELGWRFRPSARDAWDGVPVAINAKALRGPEVDYARRPGTLRVLYLGDSVTVGYGLPDPAQAYPYLTGERLQRSLGREVETVDGAVNGYTTWQEVRWFEEEGVRYQPDLVVLGFVLNDVPEELRQGLGPAGGPSKMLRLSVESGLDRLANWSSLVALGRWAALKVRFGRDIRAGAQREDAAAVRSLAASQHDEDVEPAWAAIRADLDRLATLCRARGIRLCLVIFPYAFQVPGHAQGDPQRRLTEFAKSRDLPALDLLPVLRARAEADGLRPRDFFLDEDHPSPLGSVIVADRLAEFVLGGSLLPGTR